MKSAETQLAPPRVPAHRLLPLAAATLTLLALFLVAPRSPLAAEARGKILLNHVGFLPSAAKFCLIEGSEPVDFRVVDPKTGKAVYSGRTTAVRGDFGTYLVGDFTQLTQTGSFVACVGQERSRPFRIGRDVYDDAIRKAVRYFAVQRCGPSTTGYNAPCHLDDGRRVDNKKHHDATGGWHDAGDVRKWVGATIYGMIGLSGVSETLHPSWDTGQIEDELRWGNRYFLNMQEPAGYIMDHCGGDTFAHGDQNRWTDNRVDSDDDRLIQTRRAQPTAQFNFIMAQAAMVRLTRASDPEYAQRCRMAARRCLDWCVRENAAKTAGELGAAVAACVQLHRTQEEDRYRDLAIQYAARLLDLQVIEPIDAQAPIRGFFRTSPTNGEPHKDISRGCWPLIGLCDLLERFPDHPDAPLWRRAIEAYARDYLSAMAERTPFGIVPYGLYSQKDPGGNRRIGGFWYRWFMEPDRRWWVGINTNVASAGVGLVKASRRLQQPALAHLAQRQLDWILGVNPFDASTMEKVGFNQPQRFITSEFSPPTPLIAGAVMNGIGGTADDRPYLQSGSWQTCEYWTPMVCYTIWLMAELQSGT